MKDKADAGSGFDALTAHRAFEALTPRLEDISEDELLRVNLDPQKVAILAAGIGRAVQDDRARFAKLPADEFDIKNLDDLLPVAQALWHAAIELAKASVGKTSAMLPVDLVQRASDQKQRMMKLVDYYLGDDPVAGPEIASIREGTGYVDLATDLARLSTLYAQHDALLRRDTRYYRAGDAAEAVAISQEIFVLLGQCSDEAQAHWSLTTQRVFTLLFKIYGEVSAAGRWLFRHEQGWKKFPSLYKEVRRARRARNAGDSDAADDNPADDTAPDDTAPAAQDA